MDWLEVAQFWKGPKRKQPCLIFTEDRHIVEEEIPVETGFLPNVDTRESWFQIQKLLLPYKDPTDLRLMLSERDAVPLDPMGFMSEEDVKALTDTGPIALEALKGEVQKSLGKDYKNSIASGIRFAITLIAICFGIMIIFVIQGAQ